MRIQMVCLANSVAERGRVLMGVLLASGLPVVDVNGPKWLHLVMGPKRSTLPSGLVIDILPRDILDVEVRGAGGALGVEVRGMGNTLDCQGPVIIDPYTLKLVGALARDQLMTHCVSPAAKDDGPAFIEARGCKILGAAKASGNSRKKEILLQFEYGEREYRFPIRDPWFLDLLSVEPDILARKTSHYIVLQQSKEGHWGQNRGSVMTIML